ncbi:hypothetical protein V3C99_003868, partial [Haemonchus contortus]
MVRIYYEQLQIALFKLTAVLSPMLF